MDVILQAISEQQGTRPVDAPTYQPLYALSCLPDQERQRQKREQLRYRFRYRHAVDLRWRVMQTLGDVGRRIVPYMVAVKGWR